MMTWAKNVAKILPALLLLLPLSAAADQYSHERDGLVIGLDIGPGWANAQYSLSGQIFQTKHRTALSGLFRLGFAKSEELMVSLDINGWDYNSSSSEHQLFATTGSVTWFPGGESFFLTGGVGSGSLQVYQRDAVYPQAFTERGLSFLAAAGFEYRAAPDYAIGLSANYFQVGLGDVDVLTDVKASNFAVCMHIQWYMSN